jgi:hypothetical protein
MSLTLFVFIAILDALASFIIIWPCILAFFIIITIIQTILPDGYMLGLAIWIPCFAWGLNKQLLLQEKPFWLG